MPAAITAPVPVVVELDADARWNQWAEKGRREQAAFREKTRVIAVIGGLAACAAGVAWLVISL
jgi:hypothetical protein